jgi:predicted MFS family arabinose efflux permease
MFQLTAGVLLGLGISASSFTIVIGAFGKLMPPQWRSVSFGFGTAAGSFGQFLFSPIAVGLIDRFGWIDSLLVFSGVVLLIIPFAFALTTPAPDPSRHPAAQQPLGAALKEAVRHKSYVLLVIGYFTCGFQLFFITVHLPAYLVDRGMSVEIGAWTIGVIGLFNIVGSITSGWLGDRMPKRYLLAIIYFSRSIALLIFISVPPSPTVALAFGAVIGFLWLSTVPPTTGLVAVMFGTRWLTMLAGLAFFSHQVGGFLGVWLGGLVFEHTGSYDLIWWLSILFGVMSALINLPIEEKPVVRIAPQAA